MRLFNLLAAMVGIGLMLLATPASAQDDIYLPPDDELVIAETDEGFGSDGGFFGFGEPYPPDPECVAFFTGRGDGTIPQPFDRLPNICQWRYAGFPCEPENNPPEGWLTPGGYCDKIRNPQSISPPGSGDPPPRYEPPKVN